MHEQTFRRTCAETGLNPFLCEMANLREHCSWVHAKGDATTEKAANLVSMIVEKVKRNKPLFPIKVPVTKTALVIGGGIAGIQAALDIANAGQKVVMVVQIRLIGGICRSCRKHFQRSTARNSSRRGWWKWRTPNITLYTYAEVESLTGFIGNFTALISKKAKSIDEKACTGCGECATACPIKKIPSEFNTGLGLRSAIFIPVPASRPE